MNRDLKFIPVPILYRKPETGFAAGLAGVYYYYAQENETQKPSFLKAQAVYTEKNQFLLGFDWEVFYQQNNYWINFELDFNNFLNEFYGVGNNSLLENRERYAYKLTQFYFKPRKLVGESIYLGALFDFSRLADLQSLDSIQLFKGELLGSGGSINTGVGINFLYDTRDNRFTAHNGILFDFKYLRYGKFLGGENRFNLTDLDVRTFRKIHPKWVLAAQYKLRHAKGDVPFNYLSQIGGDQIMRAYFMGRYSDKYLMASQLELRFQLHKYFGLTSFISTGKVGSSMTSFANNSLHYTYGGGFRVPLSIKERINGRFDIGRNDEGQVAWYLSITEAF